MNSTNTEESNSASRLELKNIVFDVGKVLIDFSTETFIEFLLAKGAQACSNLEFMKKTDMFFYERGEISSEEFLNKVSPLLSVATEREELKCAWLKMFNPIPEMLELLDSLSSRYPCYLLSNTNEMHWAYLSEEYSFPSRVKGMMTSFQAGAMKPDPLIYERIESDFSLNPKETLLIDDMRENIDAAIARGWQGIVHRSPAETKEHLMKLGLIPA